MKTPPAKTPTTTGLAIAVGLLLQTAGASGQTTSWDTVDSIFPGAYARGVVTDTLGTVFVAGEMDDAAGVSRVVVMKSTDQGTTWDSNPATPDVDEPSDTFASSDGSDASFGGITAAPVNGVDHLITTGTDGNGRWLVRRSLDSGQTWVTLESFLYSRSVVSGWAGRAAIDSTSRIYVGGSVVEKSKGITITRNLIRKFQNGKWSTIGTAFYPGAILCSGTNVFTLTNTTDSWQIRKSSDGGNTWSLVDQYRFDASDRTDALDMAADSQGNVYVVGRGQRSTTSGSGAVFSESIWIVRKGTVAGTQWQSLDVFAPDGHVSDFGDSQFGAQRAWPNGITVSPGGDVLVTGVGVLAGTGQSWITRQFSALTGTWATVDNYIEPGFYDRQGRKVAVDATGNVFTVGIIRNSISNSEWVVRRSLVP